MALRWKKNPLPTGLAGVCARPQGSTLRDGERRYATTEYIDNRFDKTRKVGWFWVAGWQSGVPHRNTHKEPVADEATAKAAAMQYVRAHLNQAATQPKEG